jgi:hypothetical protein
MVQFFDTIPPHLLSWIPLQHVFWVATAPLDAEGHVNLSPKGVKGSFHIVDDKTVWYEDLTGSGRLLFPSNGAAQGFGLARFDADTWPYGFFIFLFYFIYFSCFS